MGASGTLPTNVVVDTTETILFSETGGSSSTFATFTEFDHTNVYMGPIPTSPVGDYYKPTDLIDLQMNVEFYTDAPAVQLKMERSNSAIRFFVDGNPIHEVQINLGYSQRIYTLTFPSSYKTRKVKIQGTRMGFDSVFVEGNSGEYKVWPVPKNERKPLLAVITDSYGNSVNGGVNTGYGESFVEKLGDILNMDTWADARNSSAWTSTGVNAIATRAGYMQNLEREPTYIFACMGYNDKYASEANIKTAVDTWITDITGYWPNAKLLVTGPWLPVTTDTLLSNVNGYISDQTSVSGIDFVDITDAVNNTNKATYIDTDGTHPTTAGHTYYAQRIVDEASRIGFFD